MCVPVFVLGKQRSGTTWLANQLCRHPSIAGVQHEEHHGVHESAFFSHVSGRYGDLSYRVNFIEFVEVMAAADYFRLAGAGKDYLYSLWPCDYATVFRRVMERYATEREASHWLEKTPTHTPCVARLAESFPDARFVAVVRDVREVVESSLARPRPAGFETRARLRWHLILRTVTSWAYYSAVIRRFSRHSRRILVLEFEDLRSDLEATLRAVCDFLGLPFDPEMCVGEYRPNTSFEEEAAREAVLSWTERKLVSGLAGWLSLVPGFAFERITGRRSPRERPLPRWFFSLAPIRLGPDGVAGPLPSPTSVVPGPFTS